MFDEDALRAVVCAWHHRVVDGRVVGSDHGEQGIRVELGVLARTHAEVDGVRPRVSANAQAVRRDGGGWGRQRQRQNIAEDGESPTRAHADTLTQREGESDGAHSDSMVRVRGDAAVQARGGAVSHTRSSFPHPSSLAGASGDARLWLQRVTRAPQTVLTMISGGGSER